MHSQQDLQQVEPVGGRCATHPDRAASTTCARCGNFMCTDCLQGSAQHCPPCLARTGWSEDSEARAMAWVGKRVTATRVFIGALGVLVGTVVFGVTYFMLRNAALRSEGRHWPPMSVGISFVLAAIPVLVAQRVSRLIIRRTLSHWTATAARRFDVPPSVLTELFVAFR